jgi:hypothetical protein
MTEGKSNLPQPASLKNWIGDIAEISEIGEAQQNLLLKDLREEISFLELSRKGSILLGIKLEDLRLEDLGLWMRFKKGKLTLDQVKRQQNFFANIVIDTESEKGQKPEERLAPRIEAAQKLLRYMEIEIKRSGIVDNTAEPVNKKKRTEMLKLKLERIMTEPNPILEKIDLDQLDAGDAFVFEKFQNNKLGVEEVERQIDLLKNEPGYESSVVLLEYMLSVLNSPKEEVIQRGKLKLGIDRESFEVFEKWKKKSTAAVLNYMQPPFNLELVLLYAKRPALLKDGEAKGMKEAKIAQFFLKWLEQYSD